MLTEVQLRYIPRSDFVEPRVRLIVFRDIGSAILDIRYSVIAEFGRPASEGQDDLLKAFRQIIPQVLGSLNQRIAEIPAGGVLFVTGDMLNVATRRASA